jgi:hypothetical protein
MLLVYIEDSARYIEILDIYVVILTACMFLKPYLSGCENRSTGPLSPIRDVSSAFSILGPCQDFS